MNKNIEREMKIQIVQNCITDTDGYFSKLSSAIQTMIQFVERNWECTESILKVYKSYLDTGSGNQTVKHAMAEIIEILSNGKQHFDAEIKKLRNVMDDAGRYKNFCRNFKNEIKLYIGACEKIANLQKQLLKLKEKTPQDNAPINLAEAELLKLNVNLLQSDKDIEKMALNFERKKIADIKSTLLDFFTSQLYINAKNLEIFTKAYQHASLINEQDDFEEFSALWNQQKNCLTFGNTKKLSKSSGSSLGGSLSNLFSPKKKETAENLD